MLAHVLRRLQELADAAFRALHRHLANALRPATTGSLVLGTASDLLRSRPELIAENAFLRQQLIVLARSTRRPHLSRSDRALLVLLASRVRAWRQALLIVQPATLLRWHRAGFRLFWRWRSAPRSHQPRVSPETVALIRRMARENRLWGAERIRGELLKLGVAVGKRTVQRHMRGTRPPRPAGQTWATFLRAFARVAAASAIEEIVTPVRAPRANAVCERFLGSVRRECIDHVLILSERHLGRVLAEYVSHFNGARPHQGIDQRTPLSAGTIAVPRRRRVADDVIGVPVLGGLHHEYRLVA